MLLNAGTRSETLGRTLLTTLAAVYWVLSLPAVSAPFSRWTSGDARAIASADEARGVRTLVVLGNGSVHYTDGRRHVDYLTRRSVFCAFEAARVYAMCVPELVIASGGSHGGRSEAELLRELLVHFGVPQNVVTLEDRSQTTAEQVQAIRAIVGEAVSRPLIVVTTPSHWPRVRSLFERIGLPVVPSITPELRYDEGQAGWRRWWPSQAALAGSAAASYELLARVGSRRMHR